jgi:hypothetical protein
MLVDLGPVHSRRIRGLCLAAKAILDLLRPLSRVLLLTQLPLLISLSLLNLLPGNQHSCDSRQTQSSDEQTLPHLARPF